MAVLNIDMDYFLNKIHYTMDGSNNRLCSDEYIAWTKDDFKKFIENVLGLSKDKKTRGKVVNHHQEAFYYWRENIERNIISIPFKLIHIDAHADLSYMPDGSFQYINNKYIDKPYSEKTYPENLRDFGSYAKFDCGNYLLYALACGWINEMDYAFHPELEELDFPHFLAEKVENKNVFSIGDKNSKKLYQLYINPVKREDLIINEKIDFITVAKSPQFTPIESDELLEILKQYLILE